MAFLIKNCNLHCTDSRADVRILADSVAEIGEVLRADPGETIIDAGGGSLLPALHDHHLHLVSLAASLYSVRCGPPEVTDEQQLYQKLRDENSGESETWLRGIGYHPCVAGDIDRHWLDRCVPVRRWLEEASSCWRAFLRILRDREGEVAGSKAFVEALFLCRAWGTEAVTRAIQQTLSHPETSVSTLRYHLWRRREQETPPVPSLGMAGPAVQGCCAAEYMDLCRGRES